MVLARRITNSLRFHLANFEIFKVKSKTPGLFFYSGKRRLPPNRLITGTTSLSFPAFIIFAKTEMMMTIGICSCPTLNLPKMSVYRPLFAPRWDLIENNPLFEQRIALLMTGTG